MLFDYFTIFIAVVGSLEQKKEIVCLEGSILFLFNFQEEEQKRLELEMQKRRERIERWRAERKKKEVEQLKKEVKLSLGK